MNNGKNRQGLAAAAALAFGVLVLAVPEAAARGFAGGTALCLQSVLPALFPFFVVCELLTAAPPPAALLRPKTGEKHCGDQCAVFDAGGLTCLALSDGMGSGESAHCEAAMTIRLLRQFLQAGIEPLPALKTLNTAAMLRCQGGAGFTTIDLACLDRAEGVLTLYKYGAAPSYIKRQGAVARYRAEFRALVEEQVKVLKAKESLFD